MKKTIFGLMAMMMLLIASCSKNDTDILLSVPKDSQAVILVNTPAINDKLKAEGEESLGATLEKYLGQGLGPQASYVFGQDSPVDFDAPMVFFFEDYHPVYTFYVKDGSAFRQTMKDKFGVDATETTGVYVLSNGIMFQKGRQVWISPDSYLKTDDVLLYANLKEDLSICSVKAAERLRSGKHDVNALIDIDLLLQLFDNGNSSQYKMMLNLMFNQPALLSAYIDFNSGNVKSEIKVLDKKGEEAKCAFIPSEINTEALKSFPGKGTIFGAIGLDSKFIGKIAGQLGMLGIPAETVETIKSLNGNMAFALNSNADSMMMMFTMTDEAAAGKAVPAITEQLGKENVSVSAEGNIVYVSAGENTGTPFASYASRFKDSSVGFVVLLDQIQGTDSKIVAEYASVFTAMLEDDDDEFELHLTLDTAKDRNSLISLLEIFSKLN